MSSADVAVTTPLRRRRALSSLRPEGAVRGNADESLGARAITHFSDAWSPIWARL